MKDNNTILVVDDDPAVLEMVCEGLIENNFEVIAASNPSDALKKVENQEISFALLDLDLNWNKVTGIELGQELRAKFKDVIVIIMTGYHNIKHAVDAMRRLSFYYLIKPFKIDQVMSIAERAQWEIQLIEENIKLKETVGFLQTENERLNAVIKKIMPEEKGMSLNTQDKALKQKLRNVKALESYEIYKNQNFPKPGKPEPTKLK
ncbi:MAG: response regulator [Calditrichales bacterium]|nr:response regulator [Calditrichales bacterium]